MRQTFISLINVRERTQAKIIDSKLVAGDVSSEFSRCSQVGLEPRGRLRGLVSGFELARGRLPPNTAYLVDTVRLMSVIFLIMLGRGIPAIVFGRAQYAESGVIKFLLAP